MKDNKFDRGDTGNGLGITIGQLPGNGSEQGDADGGARLPDGTYRFVVESAAPGISRTNNPTVRLHLCLFDRNGLKKGYLIRNQAFHGKGGQVFAAMLKAMGVAASCAPDQELHAEDLVERDFVGVLSWNGDFANITDIVPADDWRTDA